jgi:hypothetical protein
MLKFQGFSAVLARIKMNILHVDSILGAFKQKRAEMALPVLASILILSYVGNAGCGICLQLH